MQKTERDLTDIEMIDALLDIVEIVIIAYDQPIRKEFEKKSRCEQVGYDTIRLLIDRGIMQTGKREGQMRLETEKKEN